MSWVMLGCMLFAGFAFGLGLSEWLRSRELCYLMDLLLRFDQAINGLRREVAELRQRQVNQEGDWWKDA